jgi:hypothetical protein
MGMLNGPRDKNEDKGSRPPCLRLPATRLERRAFMDVIMLQGWQALWTGFLQARKNNSFRLRVPRRAGTGNPFHAATKWRIESRVSKTAVRKTDAGIAPASGRRRFFTNDYLDIKCQSQSIVLPLGK